jgi:hypothetical protein
MLTLAVGLGGLFAGIPNWWAAFVIGFGFVLPAVSLREHSDDEEHADGSTPNTDASAGHTATSSTTTQGARDDSKNDALETLRDRYARGELSEEQFETKLERLLETETLEDARDTADRPRRGRPENARQTDDERDREFEYEGSGESLNGVGSSR